MSLQMQGAIGYQQSCMLLYIKTLEPIKNHCAQRVECQRVILNTTPGNICFVEYVEYVLKASSRGLHYQFFCLPRSCQNIFKMCLRDVLKKTSCKHILKTFFKTSLKMNNSHTHLVFRTPSSHIGR